MQTDDTSLLFQSDAQLADSARRGEQVIKYASLGSPLRVTSKILALAIQGDDVFCAESGWQARRVNLHSRTTTKLYKGHRGPVTSVAVAARLVTGSWDKTYRIWDIKSGETLQVVEIHADFVKSIALVDEYILSASSDRTIKVWRDGVVVQTIRHHTRPVDAIAVSGSRVWTGDSLGKVVEWRFDSGLELVHEAQPHETSVTGIHVVEDGIWTTSMDKTAIVEGAKLEHGEHVRCILAFDNHVVTGADEIWVWQDGRVLSKVPVLDVTSLQRWGNTIVSGGLDGTLRFWTIQDLLHPAIAPEGLTEEEERELAELM